MLDILFNLLIVLNALLIVPSVTIAIGLLLHLPEHLCVMIDLVNLVQMLDCLWDGMCVPNQMVNVVFFVRVMDVSFS